MRSLLKAAALLAPAVTSAFVAPAKHVDSNDVVNVVGSHSPEEVFIHFTASAPGAAVGTDDGLEFNLTVPSASTECSPHYLPLVNGVSLDAAHDDAVGDFVFGRGQLPARLINGLGVRNVDFAWTVSCVKDVGRIMAIDILQVGNFAPIPPRSGFTASFKQQGHPTILRLNTKPIDLPVPWDKVGSWLQPSEDQRLKIGIDLFSSSPLEMEFEKLRDIKAQMAPLHDMLRHQEHKILRLLKQDFRECDGMTCMVQTAMQKAPDFAHLIAEHFHHGRPHFEHFDEAEAVFNFESETLSAPPAPPTPPTPFDPVIGTTEHHPPLEFDEEEHHPSPPPPHQPFKPHHPPPLPHDPNLISAPVPHYRPPIFHHPKRPHHRVLKVASLLLVLPTIIFLATLSIRYIRNVTSPASSRRAADRAARREERCSRRAYRCAARKHRLSSLWNRWSGSRRGSGNGDYDEKRAVILQQEGVLEESMQNEIRNLRTAHELVGEMVRAEEGRARLNYAANHSSESFTPPPEEMPGSSRPIPTPRPNPFPRSILRRSTSDFSAPPPRYEEELDEDMTVVDGFQYTPSGTDETPESSVVDCSPRLSIDTRSRRTSWGTDRGGRRVGDGDVKDIRD